MRKYKYIENGYIVQIGEGDGGVEISESEYEELLAMLLVRPCDPVGQVYRLKEDKTWELCAEEPVPEPDPDAEIGSMEALNIIMGGEDV